MSNTRDENETDTSNLTRGGIATFSVKVIAVGLGFFGQFLIARSIGKSGYGEFSFALVTLNFLVVAAVAGSDLVATRYVSVFRDSPAMMRHCLQWLNQRAVVLSAVYVVGSLVIVQVIKQFDDRTIWIVTQILCVAIPLQVFSSLRAGILRGRQRPVLSQVPEELVRPLLTIILVVVATSFWPETWGKLSAIHIAAILLIVLSFVLIAGQWLLMGELRGVTSEGETSVDLNSSLDQLRQWRSMAWTSTFAAMAMTIHSQCDIWMLGVLVDSEQVGPYAAAARYAAFVVFGINAVNTALGPMVANSVDQKEKLQQLASRAAFLSASLSVVVVVVLLFLPDQLLGLFGKEFDQASTPLRILVIANALNVLCGSVGMLLNMTGHHSEFMKVLVFSLVLNIVLNAVLIPIYQTKGAAIATGVSTVVWNLLGWILVRRKLKIRPTLGGWV